MRVTFLTTMPSPHSVDLFAAIEADGRITPRVLHMEMAAPDTYWGQVRLPESAEVLPGGWRDIGGGRVHWNSGVRHDLFHPARQSHSSGDLARKASCGRGPDHGRAYGAVDSMGEPFMTVSPGFRGEAYLNFGFLGILITPALAGVIVRSWDRLPLAATSQPALLVYAAGLPTIMASSRSFNFSNYYGLICLFLLLCVCDRLMRSRHPPRPMCASFRRPAAPQARALVQARAVAGARLGERILNKTDGPALSVSG